MQNFVGWDSEKKEFLGIVTIRDLLEIIVHVCQMLKDAFNREDMLSMSEKAFIQHFIEKNITPVSAPHLLKSPKSRKMLKRIDSSLMLRPDLSMLPKILQNITLEEWFRVSKDVIRVHKSQLIEFNVEDSINDVLKYMVENGIN